MPIRVNGKIPIDSSAIGFILLYVIQWLISSPLCFIIRCFYPFVCVDKEVPKANVSLQLVLLGDSLFHLITCT